MKQKGASSGKRRTGSRSAKGVGSFLNPHRKMRIGWEKAFLNSSAKSDELSASSDALSIFDKTDWKW
jgi:hypothetical protein